MTNRRRTPSPALVISVVALFVALGGTTYAATSLPRNSVGTKQLKNGAVTRKKISKNTISGLKGARGPQGPQGLRGVQGIQGVQGTPGPGSAYFDHAVSGSMQVLDSTVSVPAGAYAIHGDGLVEGSTGHGSCQLLAGGTAIANQSGGIVVNFPSPNGAVSDQGVAHLAAAGTITNECSANGSGSVVGQDSVLAIAVGSASP
jgi:hypothetical protein